MGEGFWDYMSRRLELREERRRYRLEHPQPRSWHYPDARGWIGIGIFALSVMLLRMLMQKEIREDEFFQTIATVIISNGLMAVVAWAYAATKGGGELTDRIATQAERAAGIQNDQGQNTAQGSGA